MARRAIIEFNSLICRKHSTRSDDTSGQLVDILMANKFIYRPEIFRAYSQPRKIEQNFDNNMKTFIRSYTEVKGIVIPLQIC